MKYLPFLDGNYSIAPGLVPMQKALSPLDTLVFQIDACYDEYLANKLVCREENVYKYFCDDRLLPSTAALINKYMAQQLTTDYPAVFELQHDDENFSFINHKAGEVLQWGNDWITVKGDGYISLFDALCCQAQEDFAICQVDGDQETG